MMRKPAVFFVLIFLAAALTVLPPAHAGESDVLTHVTTGRERIKGQNLPGAKQKAVEQALEQAVQHAFATLVPRQTFASNLEFLYSRLLPGTRNYIITYRVLDGIEHKGQYLVGVESKINLALIEKDLKSARILKSEGDKPVVLMLLAEQQPEDALPRYWWGNNPEPYVSLAEPVLKENMAGHRLIFARSGAGAPDPASANIEFTSIYDADAAMNLARVLNADLVIIGQARAAESFNRMGDEKTFEAEIGLTAYDLKSGTPVIQTRTTATAKSNMEDQAASLALTQAAADAGRDMGQKIESFWTQTLRQESQFDLAVRGENFLTRFIALKRRIRDIRDIENMQPKEIGASHAVLEIIYKGSPRQFADAVLLKTFEGFGIEVEAVTPEQISIRFTERTAASSSGQEADLEAVPEKTEE